MASNTDYDAFVFDLTGEHEGGFYRVVMANAPGELNRRVMINRGDKFQVMARLLDVAHGTTKDGGSDATLLVANFCFLPSREKRFVEATITWTFTSDDPAVEVSVLKMAPFGSWSLCPVKQTQETSVVGRANAGPGAGPVTASAGAEFGMKRTTELNFHTMVNGTMRMVKRNEGGHDSVRWTLAENKAARTGICRMLQVGVLLQRTVRAGKTPRPGPAPPTFRGELDVVVDKGGWSEAASKAKRVWKKAERDEAVAFRPGVDLESSEFGITKSRLSDLDLDQDVMFMSLDESFDDMRKEREARAKKRREAEEETRRQAESMSASAGRNGAPVPAPVLPPVWVYYVAAGVIGMYLWQQLMGVLFGGK